MSEVIITEALREKWNPVMEKEDKSFAGLTKDDVIIRMLENQEKWCTQSLQESTAPGTVTAGVSNWTPVLIKMARRVAPNLIAFDMFGVQPMSGPDGQVFAMRARYTNQTGNEAFVSEADSDHSGAGTHGGDNTWGFPQDHFGVGDPAAATTTGTNMTTADAEALGSDTGNAWGKMSVTIEKSSVTAGSRGLYADYSHELRQDMFNIHGENVDNILSDILVTEIQAEMNREFIRTMNIAAKIGGVGTTAAGEFDVATDSDGRWIYEKWKTILFQLELEANAIAIDTRRGKGNFVVTSANVASALAMTGILEWHQSLAQNGTLNVDPTGQTFVGTLTNGMRVIIDPYAVGDYMTIGYKGSSALDAGIFFCPYTPLEMYRAQAEDTFQPRMAFKTRYGLLANPYVYQDAAGTVQPGKGLGQGENNFFRKMRIANLL